MVINPESAVIPVNFNNQSVKNYGLDDPLPRQFIEDLKVNGILPEALEPLVQKGEPISLLQVLKTDPEMVEPYLNILGSAVKYKKSSK